MTKKESVVVTYYTIDELIKVPRLSPIPISVIPNYMGINLCSVEGIDEVRQRDGQLQQVTIYFIPAK